MSKWIKIDYSAPETIPRGFDPILLLIDGAIYQGCMSIGEFVKQSEGDYMKSVKGIVTHWRTLPKLPE